MAKQSSVNLDITNNVDGFDISGGTTPRTLSVTGGSVTLSGSGSATVTFPTTSTTIAGLGITQSFSTLQSFSAGISAAGGATLGSRVDITGILDVIGGVTLESTLDVVGVSRFAGGVTLAGTLQGTTGSFSRLLTLSNGLSAAGGFTVGNDISVFGIRVGRGNRGASAGGDTNLAVGANALNSVIPNVPAFQGVQNLAFGTSALQNTTSGGYNSAFGTEALLTNTSGGGNIAFGVHALRQNTSGVENCAFGGGPMYQNTTGSYNVAIGSLAYYYKSTGSYNVAVGFQAGYKFGTPISGTNVTSATNCTLIGTYATPLANGTSNEIVIGYQAIGKGSNTVSIGNSSITATHLTGVVNVSSGVCAAGSTFSSTTNTLDVIASTDGAGLRIAKATTGANSRIGGIRLGRNATSSVNTYIEGNAGAFAVYSGVDNTTAPFASFSGTAVSIGATTATQLTLNCPGTVQIGDASGTATLHNQQFILDGSTRFFTFGDTSGTTAGFMGINRVYNGLCADYALEVNSPTGKGLQLIYNDHTGAASNWVNMDVSSGGNYTLRPSGGLATVTGTLNVSAGISAAGGATFSGAVTIPLNTAPALTIGNNSTKNLVMSSIDGTGLIEQAGNSTATLLIRQQNGGNVQVGGAVNNTFVLINDNDQYLQIQNMGAIDIGDGAGEGNGTYLSINDAATTINAYAASFGVIGRLDMNGGYSEAGATATQATNTITFNALLGNTQKFVPSAVVNTVNFTNINTTSTQCTSATLIFLHGATPYGLTTGTFSVQLAGVTKTVKWSGGSAPTLTNTANKTDILNFLTYDGGTTWLGFVGGLNF